MRLRPEVCQSDSKQLRPIPLAAIRAVQRLRVGKFQVADPTPSAGIECLERRVLFSAYTLSEVALMGTNATGVNPESAPIVDANGNLFGTTSAGGAYAAGTVFEIAAGSSAITALASFNGANGADPTSGVALDGSGNVYGTTFEGGSFGSGTVFEIAKGSSTITTLASLNGERPSNSVALDVSGNLYGTINPDSGTGNATAFEIVKGTGTMTTLATLNGDLADGVVLDGSGNLFGMAETDNGEATVFELPRALGTLTTLAMFNLSSGTIVPGLTLDNAGNLYFTTDAGDGTILELAQGSETISTLVTFDGSNGAYPAGNLTIDRYGNLFGATLGGGADDSGSVCEIASGSSAITTLASFTSHDAVNGVTLDASGNLFGTTHSGGAAGTGYVFEIANGSTVITTRASFAGTNAEPWMGVSVDVSGNLYGTANQSNTVFEIASGSNTVTTLATINGNLGQSGLVMDASGDLYGLTTGENEVGNYGTVFEIPHDSTLLTTLASFDGTDGSMPIALTLDGAGDLFGTTTFGGANNYGTIFEIIHGSAAITALTSFGWTEYSVSGVTLASSGDLYGTTGYGGTAGYGTVFELAKGSSTITTIASFSGPDGATPQSGVTFDAAGDIYGTTVSGGVTGNGNIFEIPKGSTTFTTLVSFNGPNGAVPSGLTMDASGNFFGTTYYGGASEDEEYGTVFEMAKGSNSITTLSSFDGISAGYPHGGVSIDSRGNLYGATFYGPTFGGSSAPGTSAPGIVFKLSPNTTTTLAAAGGPNPSTGAELLNFSVHVAGAIPNGEMVRLIDASNNAVVAGGTLSSGSATLTVPAGTLLAGTHNLVAAYGGDANFAASESAAYAQTVQVVVTNVQVNGNLPSLVGVQRSMVDSIVYSFSEAVNLSGAAANVAVHSGQSGTVPSLNWAAINPNSDGSATQWAVNFSGTGVVGNSIANGVYDITLNTSAVTSDSDPSATAQPRPADTFYRLFGDINGDGVVNAADNFKFKAAMSIYNAAFDYNDDGVVNAADNFQFKASQSINFSGSGIVYTI